jgi:DAACS family dicarboxylate/amino acid:cation (Na+ or H+) symporter
MKIIIGLFLGFLTGEILGPNATYLKPIGDIFLNMIQMVVVLLVFSSMTLGITSIHDPAKLGRIGLKSLILFLTTTMIGIVIGILFAYLLQPGVGAPLPLQQSSTVDTGQLPGVLDIFINLVPKNPIAAMAKGDILQVIFFSIALGIAINFSGEKGKPLKDLLESIADVMYRLTSIVMEFAPYGVFAIMAWSAGSFGFEILIRLVKFLLCNYIAMLVHTLVVFVGILYFFARLNPIPFFKGMGDAIAMAFSTNSSSATLPVSLHCVHENLGVSKGIANFILPLGSTVNMNGAAISQGITAIFIAQAYGIDISYQTMFIIVITATLSAIGAAGIPGTTIIALSVILESVGLPTEGILMVAGVDRVREMVSTVLNILGDAVVAVYIAKLEGELDEGVYNHTELVEFDESLT